jgi:ribose/xylose/arabinose/galactoside ABC-type transport system permease subunit
MREKNLIRDKNKKGLKITDTIILIIVLGILVLFFSLMDRQFITYNNISTMLKNMVLTGVLALGLTPLMIARGLDISFGASISFTSVVMALLHNQGMNLFLIMLIGLSITTVIGLVNGLLIENFDLIPIIATLGMMAILQALALVFSGSRSISMLTEELYYFSTRSFLRIPFPVFVLIVLIAAYWFILNITKTGRVIYLVGANPKVATLSGIKTKKVKILLYMFMGLATGIATIVVISMTGVGMPYQGARLPLPTLSAVVLGGISLAGGSGSVWGTLVGVLIVTVIFNGLSVLNVPSYFIQIFQGLALILIVSTYEIRNKRAIAR